MSVTDVRSYDRKLLFVPFQKYASTISASTISAPRNTESLKCELVTLPTKSNQVRVPSGKKLGLICPIKEEILTPRFNPHNAESVGDRQQSLLKSFNSNSWPSYLTNEMEDLITEYQDIFALSHHELGCYTETKELN